jgi:hypothetical protein
VIRTETILHPGQYSQNELKIRRRNGMLNVGKSAWVTIRETLLGSSLMLLSLKVPASNARGPRDAEQTLAAIHQANAERLPITLMLAHHAGQAGLYVRYPQNLKAVLEQQLSAQYPHAKQERIADESLDRAKDHSTWTAELSVSPVIFPLRRYSQFEDMIDRSSSDPLAGLLTAIAPTKQDSLHCRIELHVRPTSRWRHWRARRVVDRLAWPFFARRWFFSELYASAAMHRVLAVRVQILKTGC